MVIRHSLVLPMLVFALLLWMVPASAQSTYALSVTTNASSYSSGQQIMVTGSVTPAPGPSTGVSLRVLNPAGQLVAAGDAPVGASSGSYNYTFVAGGTADWTTGTYTLNATWGAYAPTLSKTVTFAYTAGTVTTSTTSSSSSSTTTTTTSSSSTTTTTSSSSSTSTTPTSSTSTSSSSGGGGIPEFPYQASLTALVAVAVVAAYLLTRRSASRTPVIPPPR